MRTNREVVTKLLLFFRKPNPKIIAVVQGSDPSILIKHQKRGREEVLVSFAKMRQISTDFPNRGGIVPVEPIGRYGLYIAMVGFLIRLIEISLLSTANTRSTTRWGHSIIEPVQSTSLYFKRVLLLKH